MISKLLYFCIFVSLLSINNIEGSFSVCGDWQFQIYRDEKCIKILDTENMVPFDEALKSCPQMDKNSQILTIHSKEEQDFLNEYLFKTKKLVDSIWIGLRNKTKIFEWTDSSTKPYTNWKKEYPNNKSDYNCVQLDQESMQWMNKPCNQKGLVVCQKLPDYTFPDILKQIIETNEKLKITEIELNITEKELKICQNEVKIAQEKLTITERQLQLNNEIITQAKSKIKVNEERLKKTYEVSHYRLFTDNNGKTKAFILPFDGMKNKYTFDDSVNLCKTFNSTLIEIESKEKQLILESFLDDLDHEYVVWINGERNSSGVWKWLKSNTPFIFTNWGNNYNETASTKNNIVEFNNKWVNDIKTQTHNVICEHSFIF